MIPQNEMGVIILFAQQAESAGFEIAEIGIEYPDAIIEKDGMRYRAEFEFKAYNFLIHRHDPREADIIICWDDDYPGSVLPIIELSSGDWVEKEIILPSDIEREKEYWRIRALIAERQITNLESKIAQITGKTPEEITEFQCKCGRIFETVQALSAHKRFCARIKNIEAGMVKVNGNGHTPA